MNGRKRASFLFGLLAVACLAASTAAAEPPLWGGLRPGPYTVGFRSSWEFDYSRRYNMTFDDKTTYAPGKAPRPILVNVWYPAKAGNAARMPHGGYLDIRSDDPLLAKYAAKLAEYERSTIAREVLGKPWAELDEREKAVLNGLFETPTASVRGAPAEAGPFPLVIYHAGAGSSYEDNAVMCEFLASHGFVVIGSAFPQLDGRSFNTDNREGSAGDFDFLIAHAQTMPNVDWARIGLVGHSAGAQASLVYRSQPGRAVDAVVSLDTTQDYRGIKDPLWSFTEKVLSNREHFDCPLVMAAGPHAFFELADTLDRAERYYLTIPGLDHNDFITQGLISRELKLKLPAGKDEDRTKDTAALTKARAGYEVLCRYILRFLEAQLKGDTAAQKSMATMHRRTRIGQEPHVEAMPRGSSGPEPYRDDAGVPPSPRQVRPYLREHGTQKTIELLRRHRKDAVGHPVFSETYQLNLVSDLLDRGELKEAVAFLDYFRETGQDCKDAFLKIGKGFQKMGYGRFAAPYFRRVLLLEPGNTEAAEGLKEIEAKKDGR